MYLSNQLRRVLTVAPVNPALLTLPLRGLPDRLKLFVSNAQDQIQMDGTMNITAAVAQPPVDQIHIPTWYEFSQEIENCWCHMGWVGATSGKPPKSPW